jgi:hypothetical protein
MTILMKRAKDPSEKSQKCSPCLRTHTLYYTHTQTHTDSRMKSYTFFRNIHLTRPQFAHIEEIDWSFVCVHLHGNIVLH